MTCARCNKANRDGARFCDGCGGPLAPRCPACGAECRPEARFCDACGASLAPKPAAAAEVRKTVTIVFADLIGSTSLQERLDPESVSRVMDHYYRAVRAPIEAHGGTVVQFLGDGVMCAFGVPRVAEDDAIRAVRAAVGMQEAFRAFAQKERDLVGKIGLRVAVNTGEVVVTDERAAGIGDPLNVAARLQQEARDGDVLIGESTERLVRDLVTLEPVGTFNLKGRSETVRVFRVLSLERPSGAAAVAFVGRDEELRKLLAVYESAVGTPAARLAAILGSPGVGKSRLLAELARRLGVQATMLAARCDAAGGGTFAPLADALREHLGLPDAADREAIRAAIEALVPGDETRVATGIAALLAGTPAPPEETFFVVRRLLSAIATRQPVVLTIDDVQWAEPLLLDLIEHLVQWSTSTPLLVLVAARPELRDTRSSLAAPGGLVAAVVTLAGLDAGAATRLAANVIGADELPAAIAGRVLATSEGNPLFVGELVRMLVHDGVLRREGDRWTTGAELASFEMPPTIHALLAARIERLRPAERTVLERAAVVGRQFSRAAVANLLPGDVTDLDARLEALRRSELIEPDTGWLLGEPVMRFHHVLIRDAAYRRVLKGTRAELHERFADWLGSRTGETVEHDETLGWHLEQAHQHLRELGPLDAKGRALGERAARHLGAAGRRALARDDLPLAGNLLGRALERLDAEDPARADLALEWCEALLASGDVGPAAAAVEELGRLAAGSDRLRAWHTCFAGQRAVLTDPQSLRPTADAVAAAAEILTAAGDAAGEAKAHAVQAEALGRLGEFGACEAALDRALAAARRAHDRRRSNAVLAGAPLAALWGPSPVTRASGRCLDVVRVLRITQGAPAVEAVALRCQAVLEALRGRTEAARRMIAASRRMVEELGITQRLLEADMFAGMIELLEGDAAAAERFLRGAYEGFRRQGLRIDAAHAAALLGRALLAAGKAADAETLSHESEALAGDDLKAAIAWRGVRAEALARRGEHGTAVTLARAAVEIAASLDALLDHADARLALAAALRAAGRTTEAAAEEVRAIELWEAKGATLLAERARRDVSRAPVSTERQGRAAAPRLEPRRPRPNAATALAARQDAAVPARDETAVAVLLAPDLENVHHPTGSTYDREASLANWRGFLRAENPVILHTPLATLGESLALCRRFWSLDALAANAVAPFGAVEVDSLVLFEVNARGQALRVETYGLDHLGDAIARLYERYAELLPEGPARARAAQTACTFATLLRSVDRERWAAVAAPTIEFRDHRPLGYPSGRLSPEQWDRVLRVVFESVDDLRNREDEILALHAGGLLVRRLTNGTDRATGGPFERMEIVLWACGADGLLDRFELFEEGRDTEALARHDEVTGEPGAARTLAARRRVRESAATAHLSRFANAAVRAVERFAERWLARDWGGAVATFAPAPWLDDRRRLIRLQLSGEEYFAHLRLLFATRWTLWDTDLLATRGERLAVFRVRTKGDSHGVETAADFLWLVEVDAQGRREGLTIFDADELEAAYDELGDRYAAGEGRPYAELLANDRAYQRASAKRDWDMVARLLPSDFTLRSHRRLVGMDHVVDRAEYLATRGAVDDLGLQGRIRLDHLLRIGTRAMVDARTWYGTLGGGEFEDPFLVVGAHDGRHVHRADIFDLDQLEAALACYEELAARKGSRFANAASRLQERVGEAWMAHDWESIANRFAPTFRYLDRRRLVQLELDRDGVLQFLRPLFDMSGRLVMEEIIATRGDRLALTRMRFEGEDASVGPSEIESLIIAEVDGRDRQTALVRFDVEDLDAAYAELDARHTAGEAAPYPDDVGFVTFRDALARRDWDAVGALYAPDVVARDHRRLGWEELRGRAASVQMLRALVDLAPDVRLRVDHVTFSERASLVVVTWMGTRDGGAFEDQKVIVTVIDDRGLATSIDQYEVDQLDAARARFAEASAKRTAPLIENLATRLADRMSKTWQRGDWAAWEACFPPSSRMVDRRKHVQLIVDRDQFLEGYRHNFGMKTARLIGTVLGTRGNRLALCRYDWTGVDDLVGPSEIPVVDVVEVDATGELTALVLFEPDDMAAAWAELDRRYEAGEGSDYETGIVDIPAFFAARDWDALRACLAPDLVVHDHRRFGWETMHGPAAYVASLEALAQLAPDARIRVEHMVRTGDTNLSVSTIHGTREGGAFETSRVVVSEQDARGRFRRFDFYDLEQLDEAKKRFAAASVRRTTPRIENAATRLSARVEEAWRRGDFAGWAAYLPASFRSVDRRKHVHLVLDREQFIEAFRPFSKMTTSHLTSTVLATRGDRLALLRHQWKGTDDLVGPSEIDLLGIMELGPRNEHATSVLFDVDDVAAAHAELDERYAAGEAAVYGPPPPATDISRLLVARDWAGLRAGLSPDLVVHDHRSLGWETLRGPDAFIASLQALVELAPDARFRFDHVSRSERAAIVVSMLLGTRDGGEFEHERVAVNELDTHGRTLRIDFYDLEQLDQARARFAELGPRRTVPHIETAATRMGDRMYETWRDRDWDRFAALIPAHFRVPDRRKVVQLVLDREGFLEGSRVFSSMEMSDGERTVLATRGDRLELSHIVWKGSDALVGPSEVDFVALVEVDAAGNLVGYAIFDSDGLEAAYEELDERYRAGEGAAYPPAPALESLPKLLVRRDWDGIRRLLSPDLVVYDHRPLGWETLRGPDTYVSSLQSLVDLAPDARIRADHFERCERGRLIVATVHGTREGGAFEAPRVVVTELDAQGRQLRFDFYNLDQLEEARARYAEIRGRTPGDPLVAPVPPNAACAAIERVQAAYEARDWSALHAAFRPDIRVEDRRRQVLVEFGVDQFLSDFRGAAHENARWELRLVSTVGDRVALYRSVMRGGRARGPWEVECLHLTEVDEAGRIAGCAAFDVDDFREADREAWRRWLASDPVAAAVGRPLRDFSEAINERDAAKMRALLADDFTIQDHRRIPVNSIEGDGPDALVASVRVFWELAPDLRIETLRGAIAHDRRGVVSIGRSSGTLPDGGPFENYYVHVAAVEGGRFTRYENFEVEDLDAALACFRALRPDPLRIPPNAATRSNDRWQDAFNRRDWQTIEELCASSVAFDDRRRAAQLAGDRDMMLQSMRWVAARRTSRVAGTVLATAGDRLALLRLRLSGGAPGSGFEVEYLTLLEVDAAGRLIAVISFDLDDRRAASRELFEHFARGDVAPRPPRAEIDLLRAFLDHDLPRCRATLPSDFVMDDHRRTGMGRIEGADAYIDAVAALFAETPDAIVEPLYHVAREQHGLLTVAHTAGTLREGGEFESVYVWLARYEGDDFVGAELYEVEDLDVARARFEELRPKPVLIPPNAASRARDRTFAALRARDAERFRAQVSEDFVYDERSRRSLVSGGVELAIKVMQQIPPGVRVARELIATLGDRVALERTVWRGGPDGGEFEIERLQLTEIDAAGRVRATISFDPEDRDQAFAEALARFAAGEGVASQGLAPLIAFHDACNAHDAGAMRRRLADDLVLRDHRAVGVLDGLSADAMIESMRVHAELAPDLAYESFRMIACDRLGSVDAFRIFGTATNGGAFENVAVRVVLTDGERIRHYDVFDTADLERALARFDELSAASSAARAAG